MKSPAMKALDRKLVDMIVFYDMDALMYPLFYPMISQAYSKITSVHKYRLDNGLNTMSDGDIIERLYQEGYDAVTACWCEERTLRAREGFRDTGSVGTIRFYQLCKRL